MMPVLSRFLVICIALAGFLGFAGIALSALAAHSEGAQSFALLAAAMICLVHAPSLLVLASYRHLLRTALAACILLGAGTLLFALAIIWKHQTGYSLFSMAAPLGGLTMMGGWLAVLAGAFWPKGR